MKESIKTTVIDPSDGGEIEVEFVLDDGVIEVIDCDRQESLFMGDWSGNLRPLFERALELWPEDQDA